MQVSRHTRTIAAGLSRKVFYQHFLYQGKLGLDAVVSGSLVVTIVYRLQCHLDISLTHSREIRNLVFHHRLLAPSQLYIEVMGIDVVAECITCLQCKAADTALPVVHHRYLHLRQRGVVEGIGKGSSQSQIIRRKVGALNDGLHTEDAHAAHVLPLLVGTPLHPAGVLHRAAHHRQCCHFGLLAIAHADVKSFTVRDDKRRRQLGLIPSLGHLRCGLGGNHSLRQVLAFQRRTNPENEAVDIDLRSQCPA